MKLTQILMKKAVASIFFILSIINTSASFATDKLSNESHKCLIHFHSIEKQNKIPRNLLFAISLRESGKYNPITKKMSPWPWAANVEGKSYHFNSKAEAIRTIKQLLLEGKRSIDVGCMQINLLQHPEAFSTLDEAFEPIHNIKYAAKFLLSNYSKHNSWKKAVATYHSSTEHLGDNYVKLVAEIWQDLKINPYPISYPVKQYAYLASNNSNYKQVQANGSSYLSRLKSMQRMRTDMFVPVNGKKPESYKQISQNDAKPSQNQTNISKKVSIY